MSEGPPKQPPQEVESKEGAEMSPRERHLALAKELFVSGEHFPFPGLNPEAYAKMKVDEAEAEVDYPGYTTPTDDIIARCATEGIKVVLSPQHPESSTVYIMPAESSNIGQDSVMPRQLVVNEQMDARLKELIMLNKAIQEEGPQS